MSIDGVISGTPSTTGTANFTVKAVSGGSSATQALSVTVAPAVTIAVPSLPPAEVGSAYQQTLIANGGTGGYTWTVTTVAAPRAHAERSRHHRRNTVVGGDSQLHCAGHRQQLGKSDGEPVDRE